MSASDIALIILGAASLVAAIRHQFLVGRVEELAARIGAVRRVSELTSQTVHDIQNSDAASHQAWLLAKTKAELEEALEENETLRQRLAEKGGHRG
jgi:hypothetical protein